VSGGVGRVVVLSLGGAGESSGGEVSVASSRDPRGALVVTLSGATSSPAEVRLPVHIRSNTGYRLFAAAKAINSNPPRVLVAAARPTGKLVAADAVEGILVEGEFDGRPGVSEPASGARPNRPDLSTPAQLLRGARASLGGPPDSPHNAVEVVLSVAVEPRACLEGWAVELRLSAAPG
jgi:hypothetical protein